MNTLGLTVQLCSLAVDTPDATQDPSSFLARVKTYLEEETNVVGNFKSCRHTGTARVGNTIKVHTYAMTFEHKSLEMQFTFFKPDATWMIKSFKFS